MQKNNTKPPSGTRDSLPTDVKFRESIINKIRAVFENFGFLPLDTPAMERLEILLGKYGKEGEKLIFKILKRGEKAASGETDLGLRYDFTVPLARVMADNFTRLPKISKLYRIGPVWRADRPGKGRYREFYQCDADIIGKTSHLAEIEILCLLNDVLTNLQIKKYQIKVNSRKILEILMDSYEIAPMIRAKVLIVLDKLDKIGPSGIAQELKKMPLEPKIAATLASEIKNPKSKKILNRLTASKEGLQAVQELDTIIRLTNISIKSDKVVFAPFLARGLDYYTGFIFETFVPNVKGSIASGGRYDDLIGQFSSQTIPACGLSLGFERLLPLMPQRSRDKTQGVFITVWDAESEAATIKLALDLRSRGMRCEMYLGNKRISEQISLAASKNFKFCVIYGPEEQKNKQIIVKNLQNRKQKTIPLKMRQVIPVLRQ